MKNIEKQNANTPVIAENKEKKVKKLANKTLKSVNTQKQPQRLTVTTSFSVEEAAHLAYIIEERIKAGITRDNSHFLRQCVDFFINYNFVFPDKKVGMPENSKKFFLKDAYFSNKK